MVECLVEYSKGEVNFKEGPNQKGQALLTGLPFERFFPWVGDYFPWLRKGGKREVENLTIGATELGTGL